MSPRGGEIVELAGEELSYGPETVAHHPDGMVVFVPFLAPGDRARVRIESVRKNHARGSIAGPVTPGPCRTSPPCPLFGACGGCQWQHVALGSQREAKERIIRHRLSLDGDHEAMAPIRSGASALAYRNRLILPLRGGPGGLRAGFFRAYSHSLIDVESCPVQHPALWTAARRTVELLAKSGAPAWDERTGRGVLRHVVARRAAGTGQVGVIIVVNGDGFAGERELAEELLASDPSIRGVSVNTNTSLTNVILGGTTRTVAGRGKLEEEIGGMKLVASHESFFQANHEVTGMMLELLSGWAREAGAGEGGVLDIYCGTGLLGIAAARAAGASRLTGVEEVPAAVDDAGANARANGVAQARFVAGAAAMALPGMLAGQPGPGFVVLDPPRKGAEPEVLSALASLGPPCIAYVSCDPMTFARDLKRLGEGGYRLREVVPFDMFPHTYHVELAARLERAA